MSAKRDKTRDKELALLDDEALARRGFGEMAGDLDWALHVVREAERWQTTFA